MNTFMKPFDDDSKRKPSRSEVIYSKPWDYSLVFKDRKIILSVEQGKAGMYNINRELKREELEKYKEKGESYLDQLAKETRDKEGNPDSKK